MNLPEKLRLFLAFDVPREHLAAVDRAAAPLKACWPDARWAPVENQHVTLKFLGSTPAETFDRINEACAEVAPRHRPAPVSLTRFGSFPSTRRIRVLWVGMDDRDGLLPALTADLDGVLETLGFEPEKRAYTPHLTLARFKVPQRVNEPLADEPLDLSFDVGSFVLYRSHLSPRGARYEALRTFLLGSEGG